jgi:hypothetical protein
MPSRRIDFQGDLRRRGHGRGGAVRPGLVRGDVRVRLGLRVLTRPRSGWSGRAGAPWAFPRAGLFFRCGRPATVASWRDRRSEGPGDSPMPILFTCPSCRHSGRVPDSFAGKRVTCPRCGKPGAVPPLPSVEGLRRAPARPHPSSPDRVIPTEVLEAGPSRGPARRTAASSL